MDRMAVMHVIEPGRDDVPTLYKVTLFMPDVARLGLLADNPSAWRFVIRRCRDLIAAHREAKA